MGYALQLDSQDIIDHKMGAPSFPFNQNDCAIVNKALRVSASSWMTAGWRIPSPWYTPIYTSLGEVQSLCRSLQAAMAPVP